jgi:hypothetical protein
MKNIAWSGAWQGKGNPASRTVTSSNRTPPDGQSRTSAQGTRGLVEDLNARTKLIKRQVHGRAAFPLVPQRHPQHQVEHQIRNKQETYARVGLVVVHYSYLL